MVRRIVTTGILGAMALALFAHGAFAQSTQSSAAGSTFVETYWKAAEVGGVPVPAQDSSREAHLLFQSATSVSGSDGCNRITGTYKLAGDALTFGPMAVTRIACVGTEAVERAFQELLKNAARMKVTGDRLELFDAKGMVIAIFRAGTAPPARS